MSVLEKKYFNSYLSQFKPILYSRYVNDPFWLFKNSKDVGVFLYSINNAHPSIQFMVEIENCGSIPFLDVSVSKSANGFPLVSLGKRLTGLYSDHSSLTPKWYKINLINT